MTCSVRVLGTFRGSPFNPNSQIEGHCSVPIATFSDPRVLTRRHTHAINPQPASSLLFLRTHPAVLVHARPLPVFRTLHQTSTHGVQMDNPSLEAWPLSSASPPSRRCTRSYRNGRRSRDMPPVYLPPGPLATPKAPRPKKQQTLGSRSALALCLLTNETR